MKRFFPYPTMAEELTLVAESQTVDGMAPPYDMLAARRTINLSDLPAGWRRGVIQLRVDLPSTPEMAALTDIQVVLTLNCGPTNLRMGVPMRPGVRLRSYVADLEIEAGAFAKKATLRAVVSGTVNGVTHRFFGESDTWNVWVSTPEIPLLTGDLQVSWADFSGEDCPLTIDPVFREQAYYVDVTADPPIIYLNEATPDLRRLFDESPRRSVGERALREAHFLAIASAGWLAMFNASLGAINQDEESVVWPDVEWQRQVLLTVLPKVYPDLSPEDALQTAYEDDASADGARLLQSRAMAAVQLILQSTPKIRRSIKALEALDD